MNRIALYGPNMGQILYTLAKHMRASGIDVRLLLDSRNSQVLNRPIWHEIPFGLPPDHRLLTNYVGEEAKTTLTNLERRMGWHNPSWVDSLDQTSSKGLDLVSIPFNYARGGRPFFHLCRILLGRPSTEAPIEAAASWRIITSLSGYGFIVTQGRGAVHAYLSGKPYAVIPYGADVRAEYLSKSRIAVGALEHAWAVLAYGMVPRWLQEQRIGTKSLPFPWLVDHNVFKPLDGVRLTEFLDGETAKRIDGRFVFLHPSRTDFLWKGNDRVLSAFRRLAKENDRVALLCSPWGEDRGRLAEMIRSWDLGDSVFFLKHVYSEPALARLFSACDVVLDQFPHHRVGALGGVGIQALASQKPLITDYDWALGESLFDEHPPLMSADTEDKIYDAMRALLDSSATAQDLGRRARGWSLKYQGQTAARRVIDWLTRFNESPG